MSAGDELRQAAATLRETSRAAVEVTGGWFDAQSIVGWHEPENAEHIATMSPAVGLALADWLDDAATRRYHTPTPPDYPLTIARLINGGAA